MSLKEDWDNAVVSKRVVYIPKAFDLSMNWDDAIELLNKASSKTDTPNAKIWKDGFEPGGFKVIGECATRQFGFFQASFTTDYSDAISNCVKNVLSTIDSPVQTDDGQIFANFIYSYNYQSNPHRDNWPVLYLQLVNRVVWDIYDVNDLENVKQSVTMKPGDALLVPKGTLHNVRVIEPRFSLSFGFGDPAALDGSVYSDYLES